MRPRTPAFPVTLLFITFCSLASHCSKSQNAATNNATAVTPASDASILDRPKARTLIENTRGFSSTTSIPVSATYDTTKWFQSNMLEFQYGTEGRVTPEASKYFKALGTRGATLTVPAKRNLVEVTGISAGENANEKEIEFKWSYDDSMSKIVYIYTGTPKGIRPGTATAKLYDDGWRVVKINLDVRHQYVGSGKEYTSERGWE